MSEAGPASEAEAAQVVYLETPEATNRAPSACHSRPSLVRFGS